MGPAIGTASEANPTQQLSSALATLDGWLGEGPNGDRWRVYLKTEELREQIRRGDDANTEAVQEVLAQYRSDANGLDRPRFVAVRKELLRWLTHLKTQKSDEPLPELVWELRGEHTPLDDERFVEVRESLIRHARALERALGPGTQRAAQWKDYLKWEQLEPHFTEEVTINRESLEQLEAILRRFRANHPGLELPVFTRLASAVDRYRELAFWNAVAKRRDPAPVYEGLVKNLQEQLRRHQQTPTVETTRQIGKVLGTLSHLGDSPDLVEVVRAEYSQPNVFAEVSVETLNGLAQPVSRIQAVRECILGVSVHGTAFAQGRVHFAGYESPQQVALAIYLNGHIDTNSVGYRKPVQISSTGVTNYSATKQIFLSDERFYSTNASVSAQTRNNVHSVQKTGGNFGKRLVEKIAWKRVLESKPQSEQIAAQKARQRVAANFDEQVVEALTNSRETYQGRLRDPLVRRGLLPEYLHFASSRENLYADSTLSTVRQISTATPPPTKLLKNDLTVRIHETAVNNLIPSMLAGVSIRQDTADEPQIIEGDAPEWLLKLPTDEQVQEAVATVVGDAPPPPAEEFRPWHLVFNSEHPASVSFDDQKITLRLRFARLKTSLDEDDAPLENWDFLVTYEIVRDGERIIFRRLGDIEALPTGFDPEWDTRLTSEQVGYRNNLARNINRRAAQGEGFPQEIVLPDIRLPNADEDEPALLLQQLESDNGWLTIGYNLP